MGPLQALSSCGCGAQGGDLWELRQAGVSPGARGAGSRRCQELRRLALIEREERALRPGYNSSLFSVIALAREQVPWRHLEPEMSIDLLRL